MRISSPRRSSRLLAAWLPPGGKVRQPLMNNRSENHTRVLAIDPSYRDFGYAVLDGASCLLDCGVRTTRRDKNAASLREIARLIDFWQPDVLAIEDYTAKGSRRCIRVRDLLMRIRRMASTK